MKAKRAAQIAKRANGEMPSNSVMQQIYAAAAGGLFMTSVEVGIIEDEAAVLESLGYTIERTGTHYGDNYILVSWVS